MPKTKSREKEAAVRTRRIMVRLSASELRSLERLARREAIPRATYIRSVLMKHLRASASAAAGARGGEGTADGY